MQQVIQCVPNFSEGRDQAVIEAIVNAVRNEPEVKVIDYSSDPDHNRMVLTLLGGPEDIRKAIFAAARKAIELIDLRKHTGAHPRIGAVDVVPVVPIQDVTMADCIDLSYRIGHDLAEDLGIPVYYYERSAIKSHRVNLPDIRKGGFEHLVEEVELTGRHTPDLGPHRAHPTAGAVVVGARGPLIAYNINLNFQDMEVARAIVRKIRSGEADLEGVKSMSVWLAAKSMVQVSMNITRPDVTPLKEVFNFVQAEAHSLGIEVVESEIIGAIRLNDLAGTSPQELKVVDFKDSQIIENWLK